MVPAEDTDCEGEAWPAWQRPGRDAVLQPPPLLYRFPMAWIQLSTSAWGTVSSSLTTTRPLSACDFVRAMCAYGPGSRGGTRRTAKTKLELKPLVIVAEARGFEPRMAAKPNRISSAAP
jgi:hypothetical protein